MTPTKRLRQLLSEREVEWRETAWGETRWLSSVLNGNVSAREVNGKLVLFAGYKLITPEQAIDATLGREPDDAAMVRLHDQMNATMLKYEMAQGIEKRDEDEAIVVPWVAKMHSLLEEAANLGRGECYDDSKSTSFFCCSECGCTHWRDVTFVDMPRYCPNCGRRVVSE